MVNGMPMDIGQQRMMREIQEAQMQQIGLQTQKLQLECEALKASIETQKTQEASWREQTNYWTLKARTQRLMLEQAEAEALARTPRTS